MTPVSSLPNDRSGLAPAPNASEQEAERLRRDLVRMTAYARALEQRCNRLWTYVPDTHGTHDPAIPLVARHCNMLVARGGAVAAGNDTAHLSAD